MMVEEGFIFYFGERATLLVQFKIIDSNPLGNSTLY